MCCALCTLHHRDGVPVQVTHAHGVTTLTDPSVRVPRPWPWLRVTGERKQLTRGALLRLAWGALARHLGVLLVPAALSLR